MNVKCHEMPLQGHVQGYKYSPQTTHHNSSDKASAADLKAHNNRQGALETGSTPRRQFEYFTDS